MFDPSPERGPQTPNEELIAGLIITLMACLLLLEWVQNFQPAKLSFIFFLLFWCPLLVLHEAGHAWMAAGVGWSIDQVVIGIGRPLKRFQVGTVAVEWRLLPLEGFTRCRPKNLELPRLKNGLIYFAGPGIELLLAALILVAVGPPNLLRSSNEIGMIAIQSLAVASCCSGIMNLIPYSLRTPTRTIVNDGLGILLAIITPRQKYIETLKPMIQPPDI
ncbi:MAG: site-2 protease family protein [Thermosynechococcaceae cyanobacterium]